MKIQGKIWVTQYFWEQFRITLEALQEHFQVKKLFVNWANLVFGSTLDFKEIFVSTQGALWKLTKNRLICLPVVRIENGRMVLIVIRIWQWWVGHVSPTPHGWGKLLFMLKEKKNVKFTKNHNFTKIHVISRKITKFQVNLRTIT